MIKAFKLFIDILAVLICIGFVFSLICLFGAMDYTRRCVFIEPRKEVKVIEAGKTYNIEYFFDIRKEDGTGDREISVYWDDYSKDNIEVDRAGNITVTAGSGNLVIALRGRNKNSPEEAGAEIRVAVE